MFENTVIVSGRKRHPVQHFCKSMDDAVAVARRMVAEGYNRVMIGREKFGDA